MTRTLVDVFTQIEEAVRTLRKMPGDGPRCKTSSWPDFIRRFQDAYGTAKPRCLVVPTSRQISRMDEVIEWLTLVPPETAKIIWARAERYSWRRIAGVVGRDKKTCQSRFRIGIVVIAHSVNNPKPREKRAFLRKKRA